MSTGAHRHNPAMRAHLRRFGMDHKLYRRFVAALEAIEDGVQPILIATCQTSTSAKSIGELDALQLKAALRLLANGPNNEFRKLSE